MNVGLQITKCSYKEIEGRSWEQVHLASINTNQFNIVENGRTVLTVYPYRTMYNKHHTQVWGTFKRSWLADDFEKSKQVLSEYGEIEIAFKQNCFLKEGETIINTEAFDDMLND